MSLLCRVEGGVVGVSGVVAAVEGGWVGRVQRGVRLESGRQVRVGPSGPGDGDDVGQPGVEVGDPGLEGSAGAVEAPKLAPSARSSRRNPEWAGTAVATYLVIEATDPPSLLATIAAAIPEDAPRPRAVQVGDALSGAYQESVALASNPLGSIL
jgi:hypothetical protein